MRVIIPLWAIAVILAAALAGSVSSWLDAGGETRQYWFFCEKLHWCGDLRKPTPQSFLDRDLTPPPIRFRPKKPPTEAGSQ